jgi:hypothetical protein
VAVISSEEAAVSSIPAESCSVVDEMSSTPHSRELMLLLAVVMA